MISATLCLQALRVEHVTHALRCACLQSCHYHVTQYRVRLVRGPNQTEASPVIPPSQGILSAPSASVRVNNGRQSCIETSLPFRLSTSQGVRLHLACGPRRPGRVVMRTRRVWNTHLTFTHRTVTRVQTRRKEFTSLNLTGNKQREHHLLIKLLPVIFLAREYFNIERCLSPSCLHAVITIYFFIHSFGSAVSTS